MQYYARVTKDSRKQPLSNHIKNVSSITSDLGKPIKLQSLCILAGYLHDMGKGSEGWQDYLLNSGKKVNHSPIGTAFIWSRWYNKDDDNRYRKITAQILAMVVNGHHSGFCDCIDKEHGTTFQDIAKSGLTDPNYSNAVDFIKQFISLDELDRLFDNAVTEISSFKNIIKDKYMRGLVARSILSILIDADRWDSACFEYNENSLKNSITANWQNAANQLEAYLKTFATISDIAHIRHKISTQCYNFARKIPANTGRILTLTVPTGGGKTLASLRFALQYAARSDTDIKHIFYIIPFNTILDQNAKEIRNILDNHLNILEHHGNVVFDEDVSNDEIKTHYKLTERWDSDIILTSIVQFLNALYRCENTNTRRMHSLANSVLIFDEIQALPKKCKQMFEKAVDFLVSAFNCTVILCTATQPQLNFNVTKLNLPPVEEIIPESFKLFDIMKRTNITDNTNPKKSYDTARDDLLKLIDKYQAVLMIVNTKKAAKEIYDRIKKHGIKSLYLSTDMVPKHRLSVIDDIKNNLDKRNTPIFCVSTTLIEAGINISFPCVVRSLSGLDNIMQAAGRCNRNGELNPQYGDVYVWYLKDENLGNLNEIKIAQNTTEGLFAGKYTDINSLEMITNYFSLINEKHKSTYNYPIKISGTNAENNLVDMYIGREDKCIALYGAYRTVGKEFHVIEENTIQVLVEWERGKEIACELSSNINMTNRIRLLREAGQYSISLYKNKFDELYKENAIHELSDCGVFVLKSPYYHSEIGLNRNNNNNDVLYI